MLIRMANLFATAFATAALCCATAALAQQQSKTTTPRANDYSVARESRLQGTVAKYTATSTTPPVGATVELQTSSGAVNVHLGNARLLTANHFSLEAGDSVTVVGENVPFNGGTYFAARVIQKGTLSVTLRSKNGMPLLLTPRTANGQQPAGAR